ncbi:ricin-type beta-trefoil lectin domain protein [Streptomyces sp. Ru71]|uniref:RICIN domain-containing protein n=1 Tax=Streptomyces sp. Ru71 TaxID=2080746 RepID=UPI000CDDC787|nr:RICIN domain-containing protein [Streptomyces sp. Ru71]POX50558.1 ricin-type beta-trefoil lectin domain protein [Streptomyces sp. Ru71]
MARAEADEYADASDARLTELLRTGTATAYPALRELRLRHQHRVLAYARSCTAGDAAARQLAAEVFTHAARETARGIEPAVPWRHHLLLLTASLAGSWSTDERAGGLDAGYLLVLSSTGPQGPVPPMLHAFRSLPPRAQGLIWYGIVEREPVERTAALLGLGPADVVHGTGPALKALAQASLRHRLGASPDPACGDFRRLIEESVRPDGPRDSADLQVHLAHCASCTAAREELTALRDAPGPALAEGLLPWGGTAYVRPEEPAAALALPHTEEPARRPAHRAALTSVALGVALVPLLVLLLTPADQPDPGRASAVTTPTPAPQVTVTATATVSVSPSPSPTSASPSPSRTASPSPSPTPSRTHTPAPRPTPNPRPPAPRPPGGTYAQVVNAASGLCLDVRDGYFSEGTDVVTAPCTDSPTQRWRYDADRHALQSYADPEYCLDSRGDVDRGVGIWECRSLYGRNGDNLRFVVDGDGAIRPVIDLDRAVTPGWGDGLSLEPLDGSARQRWRAGDR